MNTIKNADMPAMPPHSEFVTDFAMGITKREMFAMAAMQGLCSHSGDYHLPEHLAHDALMYADALLAALEQSK